MRCEADSATGLKLEHSSLNHEVGDEEVNEAEDWLVLHVSHSRTQKEEGIGLQEILGVQQEDVLVYAKQILLANG